MTFQESVDGIQINLSSDYRCIQYPLGTLVINSQFSELSYSLYKSKFWERRYPDVGGHRWAYWVDVDGIKTWVKKKDPIEDDVQNVTRRGHRLREHSVLSELAVLELARKRYRIAYGKELPIEQPIGAFVAKDGHRWTLYMDARNWTKHDDVSQIAEQINSLHDELVKISISTGDLQVMVKDLRNEDGSYNLVVIDTELWRKFRKGYEFS